MSAQISSLLDIKYYNSTATNFTTSCFQNVTLTPEQQKFFADRLSNIYRLYHGWLTFPLSSAGLLLTLLYMMATYRAIRQHRVSRKCYVLLLNRSLGDVVACTVALCIFAYVMSVERVNRDVMHLFDIFFVGTFWTAMVSYVSLSVLKLYAIWRPLQYRNNVTMMRCIYLIAFSWIVFAGLTTYALTTIALVKIPALNAWSGCRIETCMRPMYRRRNFAVAAVYFFTIGCFLLTLLLVRKATQLGKLFHRKSAQSSQSSASKARSVSSKISSRFPLWKLSLNVLTFAIFNLCYVIWAVTLLVTSDECSFLRNYSTMMRYLGMVRASLLLRIVMDPILSFLTDYQIRRSMLSILGISHRILPFSSRPEVLEENSSECTTAGHLKGSSKNTKSSSSGGSSQKSRDVEGGTVEDGTVADSTVTSRISLDSSIKTSRPSLNARITFK